MIKYELKKGILMKDLIAIVEYFNANCRAEYDFYYCSTPPPLIRSTIENVLCLCFDFPFEIDKEWEDEFVKFLSSIDKWEARIA